MKLKTLCLSAVLGLSVSNVNAGIPVIDAGSIAQAVLQLDQMRQQLMEAQKLLEQQKAAYGAIVGSRDVGALFNNPALKQYLPSGMQSLYNDVKNKNINGIADKMANAAKQYENNNKSGTNSASIQQAKQQNALRNKVMLDQIFDSSQQRLNQLNSLMQSVDGTQDAKAAADLGNRIQAEVGLLQAEQSKIQLVKMLADAEDKLIEQQQRAAIQNYNRVTGKTATKTVQHRF